MKFLPASGNERARWLVIGAFVLAIFLLAGTSFITLQRLSAVRAYVGGESLWSKGQKDASYHLLQYSQTLNARDLERFKLAIAIPLGDRKARLALDLPTPDRQAAAAGFLQGGIAPEDIGPMIDLFLQFRHVSFMSRAIEIWEEADQDVDALLSLAKDLQAPDAAVTPELRARRLEEMRALNANLTVLARRFSEALGEAAHKAQRVVAAFTLVLAALLALVGTWLTIGVFARLARTERSLYESNERWTMAAEAAKLEMFDWQLDTGVVTTYRSNDHAVSQIDDLLTALPELERQRITQNLEKVRQTHGIYRDERQVRTPQGQLKWIESVGRFIYDNDDTPHRMLGVRIDVSEQSRMKAALRESEHRYRMLWESAPDAILIFEAEGIIQYANPSTARIFGWSPEELVGRSTTTLQPSTMAASHGSAIANLARSGVRSADSPGSETTGQHRHGHEFAMEATFSDVEIDGRQQYAGFLRDISDRKAEEVSRAELLGQLRQSQKMEALGTLAGGIAHDFNNIVGAMLGNVAMLREDLDPSHPASVSVEQISRAAQRARDLVSQILAFSRQRPPSLVVQTLQPIVDSMVQLLRTTVPANVVLESITAAEVGPVWIMADRSQIEQVLMNLGTNAWHAAREEGARIVVGVDTRAIVRDVQSTVDGLPTGTYAHLWVADNGLGMDAATQDRVFDPFFTTKAVGYGTGLGLSVVHGIVRAHGGAIELESQLGVGTTFHVYLPLQAAANDPDAPSESDPHLLESPGQGQHVMYVDDDELMLLMVERLLQRAGFQVTPVQDVGEAMRALERDAAEFDILLTDYNMPVMTGLQLAAAVARIRADLPVVIISGDISEHLSLEASEIAVAAVIAKENAFEQLPSVLQAVSSHRRRDSGFAALSTLRGIRRMNIAPVSRSHEARRLAGLHALQVLDSKPEEMFDAIARLASDICGTPIALLSLVDDKRQWFKANVGLDGVRETPREYAFCAHTIVSDALLIVPDATRDDRFFDNPLVTHAPGIRFYAGAPLVLPGGERVGTLCVIDSQVRTLNDKQTERLRALATIAMEALLMRRDLMGQKG